MGYQEILKNPVFLKNLSRIKVLEQDRIYCKHGLEHLLDVCRIAYILNLERKLGYSRDLIYGAGLLHDIGRAMEYEKKMPHHEASALLAEEILAECGYFETDIAAVCEAIRAHRTDGNEEGLAKLLYEADKGSRCCFVCEARESCKWQEEKKNKGVLA